MEDEVSDECAGGYLVIWRLSMERGTWKWDEEKGELVTLAQADALEREKEERERRLKILTEEKVPGLYL